MTPEVFESRIVDWGRHQPDIGALVLAGSRARDEGVDELSDWDFHLLSSNPRRYLDLRWLAQIAPVLCANAAQTPRGVIKISAVFEGGYEADFIPLPTWQMKLVYWAMRHPEWRNLMPQRLQKGIGETRTFLLGSGYRILVGGSSWQRRLQALKVEWPPMPMTREEIEKHLAAFWQKAVWVAKKIARPEPRSAMHWLHLLVVEHVYALLAEEARLQGRFPRPEARKAEQWLAPRRLGQTSIQTSTDQKMLARTLLAEIVLFEEVCLSIAGTRGLVLPDYSAVAAWLRQELAKVVGPS